MSYVGEAVRYSHNSATNVSSVTVPVLQAVPIGSRLMIAVGCNPTSAMTGFTCTDTKGNTYTQRSFQSHATPVNATLGLLATYVTTALTTSDTLTLGNVATVRSPTVWNVLGEVFNDIKGDPTTHVAFDGQNSGTGTSSGPASGNAPTTSQARELVFGAVAYTTSAVFTPDTGFTSPSGGILTDTVSPRSLAVEWKYVTSVGAYGISPGLASSQSWCAAVNTYLQDAAGGTFTAITHFKNGAGTWVPAKRIRL